MIVALVAIGLAATGGAVAQADNESANESAVIHEFDESTLSLTDVSYDDGRAYVTVDTDRRETISVSDSGASGEGQFAYRTFRVDPGEETYSIPLRDDEVVSVTTAQDGYQHVGDVGVLTVIQTAPTVELVQWSAISGTVGPIAMLSVVVTVLRRSHQNTYKELTSEERIRVKKDPVDGFVDKTKRFVAENRALLAMLCAVVLYTAFYVTGHAPGLIEAYNGLTDAGRVLLIGSVAMSIVSLVPIYMLASRLYDPKKEFVVTCDARDVIEEALGADGGLSEMVEAVREGGESDDEDGDGNNYGLAIYSGSPERIADMEIEGKATDTRVPGGQCHVVESFDPENNAADGTWPGLADDFELISARSKIDGNREILRDESRMLRSLLSAMPAIEIASDTGSARAVDRELREMVTVDSSPIDGILGRAAEGTRFEGFYDDSEDETIEFEEEDDEEDDEDENEKTEATK